jgi:serine/threonine protein kinase
MSISVEHMAQMSRLLDEAMELDDAGRRRWLDGLEADHRQLERALRAALVPTERAPVLLTLPKLDASVRAFKSGESVGPYRLSRQLGAGGMAQVWLAQRVDGAFEREVALKLPRLSRPGQDLASRFVRECDILATLEHPNIVRLYDAGATAQGLRYLAMEYVDGEPLVCWCDRRHLGVQDRLTLFLQVLDAVQYAHGQQVIHRDIKPSNILVTQDGQVRLLDFGAAKLLEREELTGLTRLYGRALTPEYASPELLRGDAVSATSDVYALGIVLYELLAGSHPRAVEAGAPKRCRKRAIPPVKKPSTRVGPDAAAARATTQDQLVRRLKGDLDAIVLKALAGQPEDRYGSATTFADDLRRYLSGEPVVARADRALHRLAKVALSWGRVRPFAEAGPGSA